MSSTLTIENSTKSDIKQSIKEWAGRFAATALASRTNELIESPVSSPQGVRDKLIMAYLKRQAINTNQDDFFERLHADFWQGQGGAEFSSNCDHRFEDLFLAKQSSDFAVLKDLWKQRSPKHIVEFGCSSGLLLQHLTANLSGVDSSTGIEINAEQVKQNQAQDTFDSKIQFECADGGQWLADNGQPNTLFVTNGGVLEYFKRDRLNEMLAHICRNLGPAMFFSVEPVADDHDWDSTTKSIPFGNELSFSHNYRDLFESNGFTIMHQRPVFYESWKMVATVAVSY